MAEQTNNNMVDPTMDLNGNNINDLVNQFNNEADDIQVNFNQINNNQNGNNANQKNNNNNIMSVAMVDTTLNDLSEMIRGLTTRIASKMATVSDQIKATNNNNNNI